MGVASQSETENSFFGWIILSGLKALDNKNKKCIEIPSSAVQNQKDYFYFETVFKNSSMALLNILETLFGFETPSLIQLYSITLSKNIMTLGGSVRPRDLP